MRQEQAEVPDAVYAASNVYKPIMENDRVRVLRVLFKPGDKAAMHRHPDHSVYVIRGGRLRFNSLSGKTETVDLESGKAIFLDAQTHETTNVGDTEIEAIITEIK